MSIFTIVSALNLTKYKAAGKPKIRGYANALLDFINTRFPTETSFAVDSIAESTTAAGVTVDGVLIKDGQILNSTFETPLYHGVDPANWITYFDDFITVPLDDNTGFPTGFTIVSDAAGITGDLVDAAGGFLRISATNTDNHETYLSSLNEAFIFATNKKLIFKCRIQLTEVNTDDANFIIGLSDTVGANSLLDNGGGPMASYDGAVFFKVDGTMTVQFETSNAGAQVTNASLGTFTSGTAVTLGFVYDYNDGTTAYITPYINGVAGTAHALTIAASTEMHILMGMKNGDTNAESFLVDYIAIAQER